MHTGALTKKGRQVLANTFALTSLTVIAWSAVVAVRNPCRAERIPLASACQSAGEFLVPLLIASGFWAVGMLVWLAAGRALSLAFFALVADVLAVGMLAGTGGAGEETARLFQILLACAIPLTWHFHHSLLDRPPRRLGQIVSVALYGLAISFSASLFLWTGTLQEWDQFVILRTGIRLGLAAAWVLGWLLLFQNYRTTSPLVRSRIRLITFGTLFAFAPLVFLSLLPETSGLQYYWPYELSLPWLLISPFAYAYSLFRRRLVRSEIALNRAGVYYFLTILLLSIYLVLAAILSRLAAGWSRQWFFIGGSLSVALLLLFSPVKRASERLLAWILYGGEISYVSVIGHLSEALSTTLDRGALLRLLTLELPSVMRLDKIGLFLKNDESMLTLVSATGFQAEQLSMPNDEGLASLLMRGGVPLHDSEVRRALTGMPLGAEEQALLSIRNIIYWLPLISGDTLQGLLLIGPRSEDDLFTSEDERILATLSRQAGIAIHNVRLMEQVCAGRQELAHAHQQSLARVERERRQLALELHDRAVQQLMGISYQVYEQEDRTRLRLAASASPDEQERVQALETIRCSVLNVVSQLRGLIGELRPPELEGMGLAPAIQGHITRLEDEGGNDLPQIEVDFDPVDLDLPDSTSICLFRIAQEALRNALKHAKARHIRVGLHVRNEFVQLVVEDDGLGFRVPARLSELASWEHFGLIGIAERAAWAGGDFSIDSRPGEGTQVCVQIPLKPKEEGDGPDDSGAPRR